MEIITFILILVVCFFLAIIPRGEKEKQKKNHYDVWSCGGKRSGGAASDGHNGIGG